MVGGSPQPLHAWGTRRSAPVTTRSRSDPRCILRGDRSGSTPRHRSGVSTRRSADRTASSRVERSTRIGTRRTRPIPRRSLPLGDRNHCYETLLHPFHSCRSFLLTLDRNHYGVYPTATITRFRIAKSRGDGEEDTTTPAGVSTRDEEASPSCSLP